MKLKRTLMVIGAMLVLVPQTAHARAGDIDYTFGRYGIAKVSFGTYFDSVTDLAVQKDLKILTTGYTYKSGSADFAIARFTSKGALDKTFSRDGKTTVSFGRQDAPVRIAPAPGGKIVVAGSTMMANYDEDGNGKIESDFAVARLTSTGALDTTFASDGTTTTDFFSDGSEGEFATALAVQSDGKIIVGGVSTVDAFVTTPVGEVRERSGLIVLARYLPEGLPDPTFGSGGRVILDFLGRAELAGIALNPDGSILLGGTQWDRSEEAKSDAMLVRLTANGALDPSFGLGGRQVLDLGGVQDRISSMTMTRDRKIVLAGSTNRRNEVHVGLARFDPSGAADKTFSGDGKLSVKIGIGGDYVNDIAMQSDGKLVLTGSAFICRLIYYGSQRYRGCFRGPMVARFTSSGAYDKAFGSGGVTLPNLTASSPFVFSGSPISAMALQSDRAILGGAFGGGFDSYGYFAVARLMK